MQERHRNRLQYFNEQANTTQNYYLPYIMQFIAINSTTRILEIGCGEGGNLIPFARLGCDVTGIDISENRIAQAKKFFEAEHVKATLICADILKMENVKKEYDLILIHDVIEHIYPKALFMNVIKNFMNKGGIVFIGFPAWQMPFGGHQQIAHSKVCSKLPFIHLLPKSCYRGLLHLFGENTDCINELLDIKQCKMTIEAFEKITINCNYTIVDRYLWFINPHYKQKFGLKPRKLYSFMGHLKYIRNFFSTACFYVLQEHE